MNKIKGKEQILEEILKIGVKHKTLLALSMKTGEYSLLPEAKQFLSKAIDKAVEEERERIKELLSKNSFFAKYRSFGNEEVETRVVDYEDILDKLTNP